MSADTLMMSQSHLQSERSTHGSDLVPVQTLIQTPVQALVGGSGARPGASSRPRHPPCCRVVSRLCGRSWAELRRCQVSRIRLLLVPEGTKVWVYSRIGFQHTLRSELDFLLYSLYISSPAAGDWSRSEAPQYNATLMTSRKQDRKSGPPGEVHNSSPVSILQRDTPGHRQTGLVSLQPVRVTNKLQYPHFSAQPDC